MLGSSDEYEKCSSCGDEITEDNVSDQVSDDLCRDCRDWLETEEK